MQGITRRQFLNSVIFAGAAAAGTMAAPKIIRRAYARKATLNIGFWKHWVPGATEIHKDLIGAWAKQNRVEVTIDLIGSQCRDMRSAASAEYRTGKGHDLIVLCSFDGATYQTDLEPLNDIADNIQNKYGKFDELSTYLFHQDGKWITIPIPTGSHSFPMVSRIDLFRDHADINLLELFPTDFRKRDNTAVDGWTYDAFLGASQKLHAAGVPFGNPIAPIDEGSDWLYPLMLSFGSVPIDMDGNVAIESDGTLAGLEFMKQLAQYMPRDVYGWNNASNNRWIISGQGSCIQNPPSAWMVSKQRRPEVATQIWHHDTPKGPNGRFRGAMYVSVGIWKWCKEKKAAKDLITYLLEISQQWKILYAAQGYDMPQLLQLYAHPVWQEQGPPKGSLYNYIPRGDEKLVMGGWPAPVGIAAEIYKRHIIPAMVAKASSGDASPKEARTWAAGELEMIV